MKFSILFIALSLSLSFNAICMDKPSEENDFFELFGLTSSNENQTLSIRNEQSLSRNIPTDHLEMPIDAACNRLEIEDFKELDIDTGFGKVFLSDATALKLCSETSEAEMIRILLSRGYAHLPPIYSLSFSREKVQVKAFPTRAVIVMKRGKETLGHFMTCNTTKECLIQFRKLCLAVIDLHKLQFIHGDLKPANILIDDDNVLLIDFDQTREMGNAMGLGTDYYGNKHCAKANAACKKYDIFSLAVIFYELFYQEIFFSQPAMTNTELDERKEALAALDDKSSLLIKERMTKTDFDLENESIISVFFADSVEKILATIDQLTAAKYADDDIPRI